MKVNTKQTTLPGMPPPDTMVQTTIRFGPNSSKIIRAELLRMSNLAPDLHITDTDIIRMLLKPALIRIATDNNITLPAFFNTYL